MSNLANQLVAAERHDIARGIRLLLANPLVTERAMPEFFDLLRRRQEPMTKWFDYYCGWSLVVEPRFGYARLAKVRTDVDDSRPARRQRSGRAAFDRRRYTLLCVVCAELLSVPVTTIGLLADRVAKATAADAIVDTFDTAHKAERRAYVDVLRLLESFGAIEVIDGSTESFVDSEEAKVLYQVDATLLMRLLSAPTGPSRLGVPIEEVPSRFDELLDQLLREPRYGTAADVGEREEPEQDGHATSDVQRNLWLRHSVFRRLLDDPVVYREHLSQAQLTYLTSPTGKQLMRKAADEAGFVLEERAEGWLLVDPDALATDGKFPDDSSHAKVAALLLLDAITATNGGLTEEQLTSEAGSVLARFPRWGQKYQSDDGKSRLVRDGVTVLDDFGLVQRHAGRIQARPAARRYTLTEARTNEDASSTHTTDGANQP